MLRLAILLLLALPLAAAPVPKDEAGRIARVYGAVHDPDKGAEFRNSGDTLRVSVPLGPRLFAPFKGIHNAPRVWREVRGNFVVSVKVSFSIRTAVPAQHEDAVAARAGAGLIVWLDKGHFLTLTRDERECDGKPGEYFRAELCNKTSLRGSADYARPGRSGYLRVERWEKGLKCSYSLDGKKWAALGSYGIDWGESLKVGVTAENGYRAPFDVAFDDYTLTVTKE